MTNDYEYQVEWCEQPSQEEYFAHMAAYDEHKFLCSLDEMLKCQGVSWVQDAVQKAIKEHANKNLRDKCWELLNTRKGE
jgi:hypothetical protein